MQEYNGDLIRTIIVQYHVIDQDKDWITKYYSMALLLTYTCKEYPGWKKMFLLWPTGKTPVILNKWFDSYSNSSPHLKKCFYMSECWQKVTEYIQQVC